MQQSDYIIVNGEHQSILIDMRTQNAYDISTWDTETHDEFRYASLNDGRRFVMSRMTALEVEAFDSDPQIREPF